MSVSFQEVRQVAESLGRERQQGLAQLLAAEPNQVIWNRLAEELLHVVERFGDFASAILHHAPDVEVMFILSSHFIQVTKLDFSATRQTYGHSLPLPSVEAISNQLLILAETNPSAYLIGYALLSKYVIPCQVIRDHIEDAPLPDAVRAELIPFLDYLLVADQMVTRCEAYMGSLTDRQKMNILNQMYVLLETADWLEDELQTYQKYRGLPQFA